MISFTCITDMRQPQTSMLAIAPKLQASSAEEKAHAIQEGAQRILKTVDWLRKHRFMPPAQLKEWQHMVRSLKSFVSCCKTYDSEITVLGLTRSVEPF